MKRSEKITKLEYRINILTELLLGDSVSEQTRQVLLCSAKDWLDFSDLID